jgi:hypothetical protein
MKKIPPIYGTTEHGTMDILERWLNGSRLAAIKMLVAHISVNKPETPNNTELMAEDTIKKYIEDYFS